LGRAWTHNVALNDVAWLQFQNNSIF